jgi:hypothetical protein
MSAARRKKLAAANEFSPGQINAHEVLGLIAAHETSRDAIVEAIRAKYFTASAAAKSGAARLLQQNKRAGNVLIGASQYGLFDLKQNALTEFGRELLGTEDDEELHERLARHILANLHGLEVLHAVKELQDRDERVTKDSLHQELEQREFSLPRATTNHTKLLGWLRKAGVLDEGNAIDEERVAELSGATVGVVDEWSALTKEQQFFLRAVKAIAIATDDPIPTKQVVDAVITTYGRVFTRTDNLASALYGPLHDAGWIDWSGTGPGRGGKSGTVEAAEKLIKTDLEVLPEVERLGIPPDLRPKLKRPLVQIHKDLDSADTYTKGVALELLATRMALDLNLQPVRLRERSSVTGGAEVDLIAEGAHLHFSRWLMQCKNTKTVRVEDLAKELGMALLLRAHVIVMVTTGRFAKTVEGFAKELAEGTQHQVVLVDGLAVVRYRDAGRAALLGHFHDRAEQTLRLKRGQVLRPTTT